jgi:hypothetical protein
MINIIMIVKMKVFPIPMNYPDCDYLSVRFPDRDKGPPVLISSPPEPATLILLGLDLFYFAASNRKIDIN